MRWVVQVEVAFELKSEPPRGLVDVMQLGWYGLLIGSLLGEYR